MTYTVRELAAKLNLPFQGDGDQAISRAGSWGTMDEGCLIFLERGTKFALATDRAPGCLLAPEDLVPPGMTAMISDRPKLDFARAHALLSPRPRGTGRRHPSARVAPDALVAEDVDIGPNAVVGPCATIGPGSVLHAGVVVGEGCVVGAECILYPRVVMYPAVTLGDRVTLHAGVVAGSDGFGYVFDGKVQVKFPQSGAVIIEDDVEIGANTTIDRGSLGTTRIGAGAKIDNLVQIAHNVEIGRGVVIAAQTGISGSSVIEDYAVIGGQVGFGDHTRVESGAIIGSKAGILPGKDRPRRRGVLGCPDTSVAGVQAAERPLRAPARDEAAIGRPEVGGGAPRRGALRQTGSVVMLPHAMIQAQNLRKEFRVFRHREGVWGAVRDLFHREYRTLAAVDGINLSMQEGEFVGYIGPNGAGKSTTIKMLTGILVPTSGEINANGFRPYHDRKRYTKTIGVVFGQRTQLWWDIAVIESFKLLRRIYDVSDSDFKERLGFFGELLGLDEFLHSPVRKLSLGQRMRCDIAAALLHKPRILFLDEPTIGLDVVAKDRIRGFLKEINREFRDHDSADDPRSVGHRGTVPAHRHHRPRPHPL